MSTWKTAFDLCTRHTSLVVKDSNYCTLLVAKDLCDIHASNTKANKNKTTSQVNHFQIAIATIVRHLATKLSWRGISSVSDLKDEKFDPFKAILKLVTLQLTSLKSQDWSLWQPTTFDILMETLSLLYQKMNANAIIMATGTLAKPLSLCWDSILKV